MERIELRKVKKLKITSIVDNNADRSFTKDKNYPLVERYNFSKNMYYGIMPLAEHGFSMLLQVDDGARFSSLLIDAGVSELGFINNLKAFNIDVNNIKEVMITHGHADHFMGLKALKNHFNNDKISVIIHPKGFEQRKYSETEDGKFIYLPKLDKDELMELGFNIKTVIKPALMGNGMILSSGEVPRKDEHSNYLPFHYSKTKDNWVLDELVSDDMFAAVNVEDKGLVIITGCCHAGLMNVVNYAKEITGENRILAIVGGLHLYHSKNLDYILDEFEKIDPQFIIPSHCTGWQAIHGISNKFSDKFIQIAVGTSITF